MKKTAVFLLVLAVLAASVVAVSKQVSGADPAENPWSTKASMQVARGGLGVAVVDGKIYAIGGSTQEGSPSDGYSGGVVGTNEEYNPATDRWAFRKSMPTPRELFGIVVYQNKIYCIGGYAGKRETNVNEVYDPAADTWETKTPMPSSRAHLKANVVGGKIYLIGGVVFDVLSYQSINEVYDPAMDSWIVKVAMPTATVTGVSDVIDDEICVVNSELNQIYNAKTDTWRLGTPPPLGAGSVGYGGAGATVGVNAAKRIYVFGEQSRVQVYDASADNWTLGADMPTVRRSFGVGVVNDVFYVIGGRAEATNSTLPFDWFSYYTVNLAINERYTPFGYGTPDSSPIVLPDRIAPKIAIIEPKNVTYAEGTVPLWFTVNERVQEIAYCLDGAANVTVFGNATLTGLRLGFHNVTVYASDAAGNTGASETACFTVAELEEPFPASLMLAAASIATVAVLGFGLAYLFYFKRRKREAEEP